jgi:hypothetical protein
MGWSGRAPAPRQAKLAMVSAILDGEGRRASIRGASRRSGAPRSSMQVSGQPELSRRFLWAPWYSSPCSARSVPSRRRKHCQANHPCDFLGRSCDGCHRRNRCYLWHRRVRLAHSAGPNGLERLSQIPQQVRSVTWRPFRVVLRRPETGYP